MTRPGIEPRSPSPLANTLPTGPMIVFTYSWWGACGGMAIAVGNGHSELSSILDEAVCISHSTNTFGNGMNQITL